MNIGDKITLLREEFSEGSNLKFAELMGETPTTTSNWCKAKSLGREVIVKILSKLPNVDANWLLMDKGSMLKQPATGINNHVEGDFVGGTYIGGNNSVKGNSNIVGNNIGNTIGSGSNKLPKARNDKQLLTEIESLKSKIESMSIIIDSKDRIIEEKERLIQILLNNK